MPWFRVEVKLYVTWKLEQGCRFRVHPPTNQPFAVFPPQNFSSPQLFQSSAVLPTWCDFDLLCSRRSASSVPTPPAFMCNCAPMCTTTVQLHHHSAIVHHHSSTTPPQCNWAPPHTSYLSRAPRAAPVYVFFGRCKFLQI